MKFRFIGDVHGKFRQYKKLIQECKDSIQVGDMGVGFYRRLVGVDGIHPCENPPFDAMTAGNHVFIRGNHDNPHVCKKHKKWIPDASMHDGIFCIGGALSIDKQWREPNLDYWEDEELSVEDLNKAVDYYIKIKPRIVVSHECPESIVPHMFNWYSKMQFPSRTRQALDSMYAMHKPDLWIFGHWHLTKLYDECGTQFICLGELAHADIDILIDEKGLAYPNDYRKLHL